MKRQALVAGLLALLGALPAAFAAGSAWWSAFSDPALDRLMQLAAPADGAAEQALVETYIVARVDQTRSLLAARLLQAARNEEALLMNADPGEQRDAALGAVARRLQQIEGTARQIADERDAVSADLARRCHVDAAQVAALFGQAAGLLPKVDAPLPADAADQRRQRLADQLADVQRRSQLLEARRLEMQAHETRQRAGEGDPLQALETYQQLVLDSDRLALATGRLALSWAQWLPAPGGR